METGTEILIARMQTNPEEFSTPASLGYSKWSRVIAMANDVLPKEEMEAIKEAERRLRIDNFNGEVLKVLTGASEEVIGWDTGTTTYKVGFSDPQAMHTNQLINAAQAAKAVKLSQSELDIFSKYANQRQAMSGIARGLGDSNYLGQARQEAPEQGFFNLFNRNKK